MNAPPIPNLNLARRIVDIDRPAPDLHWLAPNIAARGMLTVLSGEGGAGKTSLMVEIADAIGRQPFNRAALMTAENVTALHMLTESMGIDSDTLTVLDGGGIDLADRDTRTALTRELLTAGGLDLLVLDSLATFAPGRDVNDGREMSPYIDGLQSIAEYMNTAIVLIHHFNKGGSSSGSHTIRDRADFTLNLTVDGRGVVKLSPDKWKLGVRPEPWYLRRVAPAHERDVLRYERIGKPRMTATVDNADRLAHLAPRPAGWSTAELRAELALSDSPADRQKLKRARDRADFQQSGADRRWRRPCDAL